MTCVLFTRHYRYVTIEDIVIIINDNSILITTIYSYFFLLLLLPVSFFH